MFGFDSESIVYEIILKLLAVPGIILAFTFKSFAQALISKWLGDPTPEAQGRLTLNPMAHIDWFGLLAMILLGFGWHKPMPTNSRFYKHPRRDKAIYSVSGPVALVLLSFVLTSLSVLFSFLAVRNQETDLGIFTIFHLLFYNASAYPLFLAVFYMLPLPGLDGYNLITSFTPYSWNEFLYKVEKYSMFIFLGFIILMCLTSLSTYLYLPATLLYNFFEGVWMAVLKPMFM